MLKKVLSLTLCFIMIIPVLVGCSGYDPDEDPGEVLNIYLGEAVYDFDPAFAYQNKNALAISSLMFVPLFSLDEDGDLVKELVDDYEITNDKNKEIYRITLTLNETMWSDGDLVSAHDVVYAWKRILNPNTASDAAVLLYDIRNAYEAKNGDCSIDDIGVYAIKDDTLQIDFDAPIDFDAFLYNLASPCLVPLRENVVGKNVDWSKRSATTCCSGPFLLRTVEYGKSFTLERNTYYFRDTKKDSIKKSVTPYQLVFDYTKDPATQVAEFKDGNLNFVGNIAVSERADNKKDAEVVSVPSTTSLYFNLNNSLFADANVRKALSLAIDRDAIAEKLVFADAATSLVPKGIFEADDADDDFATVDYLETGAKLDEAKELLKKSGIMASTTTITLTIRENDENNAVAEMIKSAWEALGFKVVIETLSYFKDTDTITKEDTVVFYDDAYLETIQAADFDVALVEVNAIATDAFHILAPYAVGFSGQKMIYTVDSFTTPTHITGYSNEEYNELIKKAFDEKNIEKRSDILHDAEKILMEDLPVVPLVVNKAAYLDETKGTDVDYFGFFDFTESKIK